MALQHQERSDGRFAPYAKLGVWGQTQWSKVVLVDVDVVFAANIDEMAALPASSKTKARICGRPAQTKRLIG